jgi:hypothetical protein
VISLDEHMRQQMCPYLGREVVDPAVEHLDTAAEWLGIGKRARVAPARSVGAHSDHNGLFRAAGTTPLDSCSDLSEDPAGEHPGKLQVGQADAALDADTHARFRSLAIHQGQC